MTDDFRVCGVVPTYNNPRTIGAVVRALRAVVDEVFVVDDAGSEQARAALESIGALAGVSVHTRSENGGKGAAVKDGLSLAETRGFSHALQVDADHQHDLTRLVDFVDAARRDPDALVLGAPQFDASAPLLRRCARQITRVWTWIETGGLAITDPMCGFRVYPVATALPAARASGDRMDFDIEVAVRMVWAGVAVVNEPVTVRYLSAAQGGVSHFRPFQDNVLISWAHTRLVIEAMWRVATGRRIRRLRR